MVRLAPNGVLGNRAGGYRGSGAGIGSGREEGRVAEVIDSERIERCEREIASALAASQDERPLNARLGILLWEVDWRAERESVVEEGGTRKG